MFNNNNCCFGYFLYICSMKRINILIVSIVALLFVSCSNTNVENIARERVESATDFMLKGFLYGDIYTFNIEDVETIVSTDSLCVLGYTTNFEDARGRFIGTMEYYLVRMKNEETGKYEYYDQAYPIYVHGNVNCYNVSDTVSLIGLYKTENGYYPTDRYKPHAMYEAAVVRTKKPLYSGPRKVEE